MDSVGLKETPVPYRELVGHSFLWPGVRIHYPLRWPISPITGFAALPTASTSSASSLTSGTSGSSDSIPPSPMLAENHFGTEAALNTALANLDARLLPFWSSSVPDQPLKVTVFLHNPNVTGASSKLQSKILHETEIITAEDGQFHEKIEIPWRDIQALESTEQGKYGGLEQLSNVGPQGAVHLRLTVGTGPTEEEQKDLPVLSSDPEDISTKTADNSVLVRVSEPSGIRVLSDIVSERHKRVGTASHAQDDTIKHSDILAGPREVFR
jgi:hypothetical protein